MIRLGQLYLEQALLVRTNICISEKRENLISDKFLLIHEYI